MGLKEYFFLALVAVIMHCQGVIGHDQKEAESTKALIYLLEYGYVDAKAWSSSLVTKETLNKFLNKAVIEFQAFAGLNQTGNLDEETVKLMQTPRCGVRDIIGHGATAKRKKRLKKINTYNQIT